MDALPLQEDTTFEFKSQNDEIFHACGHDTHVTSVLGAAEIIQNIGLNFLEKFHLYSNLQKRVQKFMIQQVTFLVEHYL